MMFSALFTMVLIQHMLEKKFVLVLMKLEFGFQMLALNQMTIAVLKLLVLVVMTTIIRTKAG